MIMRLLLVAAISILSGLYPALAGECRTVPYGTLHISGEDDALDLKICDDGISVMVSKPSKALLLRGVQSGTVLFSGNFNPEIPGLEGSLTLHDRCGVKTIPATGSPDGEWTFYGSPAIRFEFETPRRGPDCKDDRAETFGAVILITRDDAPPLAQEDATGGQPGGCQKGIYTLYEEERPGPRLHVTICRQTETSAVTMRHARSVPGVGKGGDVRGSEFFYGQYQALDGSIVGTALVRARSCRPVPYRLSGYDPRGGSKAPYFFMQGLRPTLDARCRVTNYTPVRFKLVRQGAISATATDQGCKRYDGIYEAERGYTKRRAGRSRKACPALDRVTLRIKDCRFDFSSKGHTYSGVIDAAGTVIALQASTKSKTEIVGKLREATYRNAYCGSGFFRVPKLR